MSHISNGQLVTQQRNLDIGNRIPRHFFITAGCGESDITVHAGSYHLALKDAGIESYNHIIYSSILPGIAEEVEKPAAYMHGSVMESIMAVANSHRSQRATAGIILGWLYNRQTGEKHGGIVCEYHGGLTTKKAE
jgi:arginine decarboxylase